MTRTTDTAAGGGLHCGSRARRYPRASKTTAGQTWFADGDTRVDNTEPGGPAGCIRGTETSADRRGGVGLSDVEEVGHVRR